MNIKNKFVRVINGVNSHASGYEFKIDKVNIADRWDPLANNPADFGGFNFSTENKILRFLHRGDTLYDVIVPEDAEMVEIESKNVPHGVFRTNKIIVNNPKMLTDELVINLYKNSDLPEKTYYQCLVTLLYKKHINAVKYIIKDRINKKNIDDAIKEFENFIASQNNKTFCYNDLWLINGKDALATLNTSYEDNKWYYLEMRKLFNSKLDGNKLLDRYNEMCDLYFK